MNKISRQKIVLPILMLTLLLVFSTINSQTLTVQAKEQSAKEKTLDILDNVVNLKTSSSFTDVLASQVDNLHHTLPQQQVDISLVSNQSSVRVSCSFVSNNLRLIYLSDYKGMLATNQSTSKTIDLAKDFLGKYMDYSGDSFYSRLVTMLENVNPVVNITKYSGNIKLNILNSDQKTIDYTWTYIDANGVVAKSKNVILSYYQGRLQFFLNNWPLYEIAGAPIITSEEATAIALEASENFSYDAIIDNVTKKITGCKIDPKSLGMVSLSYLNYQNQSYARDGDPFTLYPSWYVQLGFDKFYPGDVTGMTVAIWADTGKISTMGPLVADSSYKTDNTIVQEINQASAVSSASAIAISFFSIIGCLLVCRKITRLTSDKKFSKFLGILPNSHISYAKHNSC